ncbi:MAG: rhomboid family intramembrane serine protease [Marinicaulis sp.]|nr:rhomboid family intramembrane serine protease [Marinicaulis sp.]
MFPIADSIAHRFPPFATWALIALNFFVFICIEELLDPDAIEALIFKFGLVPARYFDPHWAETAGLSSSNFFPLLTDQFLHGGLFHIAANMWVLWLFGPSIEDRIGSWAFLLFYLASGMVANFTHMALHPDSVIPIIGASGAIAGILGAYTLTYPRARLIVMVPIFIFPFFFDIAALLFTGFWFVSQFIMGLQELAHPSLNGGVAFWAHVGGFIFGLFAALIWRFVATRDRPRFADEIYQGFPRANER